MLPKGKIADIGYMFGIGVFHSGVEIYDKEYNFGGHDFETTDSVLMGHTSLSREEVKNVIDGLSKEWSGNSYNLLTRNCNHFTSELCNILVGKPAPNWINRAAKLGTLFPCRFCIFTPQFTFILTHNFPMEPLLNEYDQTTSSQKSENKCVVPNDWIEAPDAESGKVFQSVNLSILIN
ncbi:22125_t:CDS:2 [Cetraspora pellucida]|uniref:22125_t:CDS:1 n=1 Tax=Cetraspora pellucida TaxID=1433469 RepID=A0A9N9A930_9GLOM|nr:22125_t:CDS:2 [Cetraspora pellucida]